MPYIVVRKWANHPNVHIALSGEQSQDTSFVLKVKVEIFIIFLT